ncbi:hypothetical protein ONE63_004551 [Megalurothrips usitatus]|uniref:Nose resistant-to-fluoxetine protein N-terminal domain-containing protein n=1 Tax=Megalurothrips usitatus TaxID=439358 RepID=A0AAV7X498_9NEOP|nr:hypothetical protein ONE63_004551 [Megalurothrips usitatus]
MEQAAGSRALWAVRMLDASAREASGLLHGVRYHLGSFDACISAAEMSPVGTRYCLVGVSYRGHQGSTPGTKSWEMVSELSPHQNASDILNGAGMAPGLLPLGDARLALCVPRSCGASELQRALQAGLGEAADAVRVTVLPEYCQEHAVVTRPLSTRAKLFWILMATLTATTIAAPALGWKSWDWRRHLRTLRVPDPAVCGLDLSALSGIRTVNAMLLLGMHHCVLMPRTAITNYDLFTNQLQARTDHPLAYRSVLFVDTFYFLAGLLLGLTSLNKKEPFWKLLANRLLRVVPVYAAVLLWYCIAMPETSSGPLWAEFVKAFSDPCKRWWWTNLLFVNNYVNGGLGEPMCMEHSWSLPVDMQMFVVGSLVSALVPGGVPGLRTLGVLTLLSTLPLSLSALWGRWPGLVRFTQSTLSRGPQVEPLFFLAYIPTHMRAAPYLAGLLAGRALPLLKERGFHPGHASSLLAVLGSVLCLGAIIFATAPLDDLRRPHDPIGAVMVAGLTPLAWSASLAVLVGSLVLGEQTVVRSFLAWQPLVTLSRLTFAMYLVSYPLQAVLNASIRSPIHLTISFVVRTNERCTALLNEYITC